MGFNDSKKLFLLLKIKLLKKDKRVLLAFNLNVVDFYEEYKLRPEFFVI